MGIDIIYSCVAKNELQYCFISKTLNGMILKGEDLVLLFEMKQNRINH